MVPGNVEIELYNTYLEPQKGSYGSAYWQRQLEMETGITDRLDFSFYLTSNDTHTTDINSNNEVKARTRFKLTEQKNDFIFDPLIYLEYTFQENRQFPDLLEFRGVMAKDIGSLHGAVNLIAQEQVNAVDFVKYWDFGYTGGVSYPVISDNFRVGIESTGDFNNNKYSLGPAVSYRGRRIWGAAGAVFGLNNNSEYIKVQAIIGVIFDLTAMPELKN